ncbi:VOC family protein [Streptomyces viridochromogenes]|uniref:Glyoxalase-like domain-containing protein n=1 Tax=Streptomyces viridochromogenes Tue57 TaxID=1160705 RepID=L8PGX6_STRVR|nr:VOC family protein [Streptomyces viridochromogenes]ELS55469.1 hypothetical protein STVIR_3564 [Streptomyces viridochromogenes Tue57]
MTETNEPAETAETADTPRTAETPAPATPAPLHWKLVIDCANPQSQADFWAAALHYAVEDNSAFIERLLELGAVPREAVVEFHARLAFRDLVAVRHPDDPYDQDSGTGLGRRLLFQRVPEAKTGKNRLHLDLHPAAGEREGEVERLERLGASVLRRVKEPGGEWVVMADPEGNEFCVQ